MTFLLRYSFELLAIAWLITASRDILFWLAFIQRKQYRLDRLRLALHERKTWKLIANPFRLTALGLFFVWQGTVRALGSGSSFDTIVVLIILFFFVQVIFTVIHLVRRSLEFPKLTIKSVGFFALILAAETLLLGWYAFWPEQVLAIAVIQPFIVLAVFALVFAPNRLLLKTRMHRAGRYRIQLPNLKVIGITGSYGKTTTKEYLAHILGSRFSVVKTPAHINVDTGVAQILLRDVKPTHQYFIVEMGAYKAGEIASICRIVKPDYAVLTAISNQHLELFGSQEQLTAAKFELPDWVKDDTHFMANAESPVLDEACRTRGRQPVWYGRKGETSLKASQAAYNEKGLHFAIDGVDFQAPFITGSAFCNLLGAITTAHVLGMSLPDIAQAVLTLPAVEHTMQARTGRQGALLIDSSYNANTDGVIEGLNDLSVYGKKTRAVVFKNIIELGEDTVRDHVRIAQTMAIKTDLVFLLPSPQIEFMAEALVNAGMLPGQIYTLERKDDFLKRINGESAVLFAGRGTEQILNELL
ncbi:MAG: UDP-N-acetylmuramoyl-tripeptide--D-alanyl-D-alanine ligase [Parcubacteria group bacterium]|nr:UDP-N-acetylmuramoyl-tripeptide--D-alanyl-D-alanine ligase [Parcubacteria group bacterium]